MFILTDYFCLFISLVNPLAELFYPLLELKFIDDSRYLCNLLLVL